MRKKMMSFFSILVVMVLIFSRLTMVVGADERVKIFFPLREAARVAERDLPYKRVIAEDIDEASVRLFEDRGCLVRHRLAGLVSFECPREVVSFLPARESRVFHVMDLEASKQIGADKVWAEGVDGYGVAVAVLDTGIQADHEELNSSIAGCENFVFGEDCRDENGHGTHVAGIITADGVYSVDGKKATGVAPGTEVYMLKVCGEDGYCLEDDMMAAMEYAVGSLPEAKVMSISIGGGNFDSHCDSDPLAAKVNWVVDSGLTVVVAAGNDGAGVSTPACASEVIAVGAVDKEGVVPYWSNRSAALDIIAPGVDILSTYSCLAAGDCASSWYAYMSGTSMSTPHVAGVVALLLEADSAATTDEIKEALYETATPAAGCQKCRRYWRGRCFGSSIAACSLEAEGAGIINAYEAYLAVKPQEPECSLDADCDDAVSCTIDTCFNEDCLYTPDDDYCPVDAWVETGNIQWLPVGECTEKEQREEEYRDYYCDLGLDCQYEVTETRWVDSGEERNKADGTICDDGEFCTVDDYCSLGVCLSGSQRTCDDGDVCTVDSCDEEAGVCVNDPVEDDPACQEEPVLCWSGDNQYLYRKGGQARKFCLCAEGNYGYQSYSYTRSRGTAYRYLDSGNNENWETVSSSSRRSVYRVKCLDGDWYNTNEDYFFSAP